MKGASTLISDIISSRHCMEEGSISASYISTKDQLADILSKALRRVKFYELRARIGMVQISPSKSDKQGLAGELLV
jgi:hypothetical protein